MKLKTQCIDPYIHDRTNCLCPWAAELLISWQVSMLAEESIQAPDWLS